MYCTINFKTKKELKEAVRNGQLVSVFQPGPFGNGPEKQGRFAVEGPHYPQPHRWYAEVLVKDGHIFSVK